MATPVYPSRVVICTPGPDGSEMGTSAIPIPVSAVSSADPGFASYRNTALSATKQTVVAAATTLWGVNLINPNTVPVYLKLYNALVGDVTVGTTAPAMTIAVPAGDGVTPGIFFARPGSVAIRAFSTGLTAAVVTGLADSSTAAPATAIHCALLTK